MDLSINIIWGLGIIILFSTLIIRRRIKVAKNDYVHFLLICLEIKNLSVIYLRKL